MNKLFIQLTYHTTTKKLDCMKTLIVSVHFEGYRYMYAVKIF